MMSSFVMTATSVLLFTELGIATPARHVGLVSRYYHQYSTAASNGHAPKVMELLLGLLPLRSSVVRTSLSAKDTCEFYPVCCRDGTEKVTKKCYYSSNEKKPEDCTSVDSDSEQKGLTAYCCGICEAETTEDGFDCGACEKVAKSTVLNYQHPGLKLERSTGL